MAFDQNVTPTLPQTSNPPASVIENEIPTYRAISPMAVTALIFGLLSVFSVVADLYFAVFALAAVVAGALAERKIQRMPDVLTGRRLAQAGIALGIIFGLWAVTRTVVQSQLLVASASKFARHFVQVLKTKPVEEAFWYKHPPEVRTERTAEEVLDLMSKSTRDSQMVTMSLTPYHAMKDRLNASGSEDVRFQKLEFYGGDGFQLFAGALLEFRGPGNKNFPDPQQYALLYIKGRVKNGKTDWWIEEVKFPYTPSTAAAPVAPVDDGHGHGHAH